MKRKKSLNCLHDLVLWNSTPYYAFIQHEKWYLGVPTQQGWLMLMHHLKTPKFDTLCPPPPPAYTSLVHILLLCCSFLKSGSAERIQEAETPIPSISLLVLLHEVAVELEIINPSHPHLRSSHVRRRWDRQSNWTCGGRVYREGHYYSPWYEGFPPRLGHPTTR